MRVKRSYRSNIIVCYVVLNLTEEKAYIKYSNKDDIKGKLYLKREKKGNQFRLKLAELDENSPLAIKYKQIARSYKRENYKDRYELCYYQRGEVIFKKKFQTVEDIAKHLGLVRRSVYRYMGRVYVKDGYSIMIRRVEIYEDKLLFREGKSKRRRRGIYE